MKYLLFIALASLISACTVHESVNPGSLPTRSVALDTGAATAQALQTRYNDTAANCGLASMPAFLCSGVMLRATQYAPTYHVWNPSPASVTSGGVSFSYLRSDAKFNQVPYYMVDGFIVRPWLQATNKFHIQVLCAFPVDGYTDRRSAAGCGPSALYPNDSDLCHLQGIQTAAQWKAHYESIPANAPNRMQHQCAFSVRDSDNNYAANNFYQALAAQRSISSLIQNELRIATWPQDIAADLPVEAFFYLDGSTAGLANAKANQQDFYTQSAGIVVPVIKLKLPRTLADTAQFTYSAGDQAVTTP